MTDLVRYASLLLVTLALGGCGRSEKPAIQDLRGQEGFSAYQLVSLRGARDGERLDTKAMFSDSSSILTLEMRFVVGTPTKLAGGTWRWARGSESGGKVAARSVTFLGGQNGPPSIGGTFDLLDPGGVAHYRITLPVTELKPQR